VAIIPLFGRERVYHRPAQGEGHHSEPVRGRLIEWQRLDRRHERVDQPVKPA